MCSDEIFSGDEILIVVAVIIVDENLSVGSFSWAFGDAFDWLASGHDQLRQSARQYNRLSVGGALAKP